MHAAGPNLKQPLVLGASGKGLRVQGILDWGVMVSLPVMEHRAQHA